MNRHHALALFLCIALLIAAGCEQSSIAEQEQIKTRQTLEAATPSVTPSPTGTPAPTNTPAPSATITPSPTTGPSPTASPTASPTITPLPPTPTPNPALAKFSLCEQTAGAPDGGRFSARLTGITTTIEPAFERVTIGLAIPGDSAAPHATASCVSAADDAGASQPGYRLLVNLDGWLHDDLFKASTISPTQALSGTTILKSLNLRSDANAAAGATLVFGLEQPLPFRLSLEKNPDRLVLEVGKSGAVAANNDALSLPATSDAKPEAPLFYLQAGDVWTFAGGKATNLTKDARAGQFGDVSALAASAAANQVVFCATAPGADVGDRGAPRSLWLIGFDGKNAQNLPLQDQSCADPAFAPDGKTIALTVDETGANPPRLSIWTIRTDGSAEQRATAADDEWSRFGPQWLDAKRLVYAAAAEDGRSTLFLRTDSGAEQDIGADLVKGDIYQSLGRPSVAPDGNAIAVEALRANGSGADLLLIDTTGALLANQNQINAGYWNRPLAWNDAGTLYYLTTDCANAAAQSYAIHARTVKTGDDRVVVAGTTLGGIGSFTANAKGLVYVTLARASSGPRGPLAIDPDSASTLWFWDIGGTGARAKLADAPSAIGALAP
jgi:hypothetical protein